MNWGALHLNVLLIITCIVRQSLSESDEEGTSTVVNIQVENEVPYSGIIHSKRTGYRGDSLVVGKQVEASDEASTTGFDYKCIIDENTKTDWNRDLEVNRLADSDATNTPSLDQQNSATPLNDYFVLTSREDWLCTHLTNTDQTFHRIVTKYISKREILYIQFHNDIEVTSVNYLSDERRTRLKEILYIRPNISPIIPFQYKGKLTLQMSTNERDNYNYPNLNEEKFHRIIVEPITHAETGSVREVKFRPAGDPARTGTISETGRSLKIGSNQRKIHADKPVARNYYTCTRLQGVLPIPHHFLTELHLEVGNGANVYAKITEKDFSKLFAIVRNEVWLCKSESGSQFYRVLNEVMGISVNDHLLPIKDIEFEDEIVAIASIKATNGKDTIRFKEISFFDVDTGDRLQHEHYYKLESPVKLNTVASFESNTTGLDLSYKLTGESVYKTLVNVDGYDLRVGVKIPYVLKLANVRPSCTKIPSIKQGLDTVFKVKVHDGMYHTMKTIQDEFTAYFLKYISRDFWSCDAITKNGIPVKFYRILNRFEILVPVREIETFDGVEVIVTENQKMKAVQINEVKYYVLYNHRLVVVDGQFDFYSYLDFIPVYDANAVSKNEWDETTRWLGHMPMHECSRFKDFDTGADSKSRLRSLTVGNKNDILDFGVKENRHMGEVDDVVICQLMTEDDWKPFPKFAVYGKNEAKTYIDETNISDRKNQTAYFEDTQTEVWLCRNLKQNYTFFRVKTNEILKKEKISSSIAEIRHSYRDKAWIELKGDGHNEFDVKVSNIRYFQDKTSNEVLDYDGYVALDHEELPSRKWKSGSLPYPLILNVEVVSSIEYALDNEENSYTFHVSRYFNTMSRAKSMQTGPDDSAGAAPLNKKTIWIGSKWTETFLGQNVICTSITTDPTSTSKLKTRVMEKNGKEEVDVFDQYFTVVSIKVWKCQSQENHVMYRVVNHLNMTNENIENIEQLKYQDGVYIFGIGRSNALYFQVAEVKYLDESYEKVYKFDGGVTLNDTDSEKNGELTPIISDKEDKVYIEEKASYSLGESEIYRFSFPTKQGSGNEGLVLEIGARSKELKMTSSRINCESGDTSIVDKYLPKVVNIGDPSAATTELEKAQLSRYFDIEQVHWKCHENKRSFMRVKNRLKLKTEYSMNTVYFYDGITINVGDVVIEETKLLEIRGWYVMSYKYDGLITFQDRLGKQVPEMSSEENQNNTDFKLNYHLDTLEASTVVESSTPVFYSKKNKEVNDQRINLEIDYPPYNRELSATINPYATCVKEIRDTLNNLKTNFRYVEKVGEDKFAWKPMSSKDENKHFNIDQEVWKCNVTTGEVKTFYRVVNEAWSMEPIFKTYYTGDVAVDAKIFMDLSRGRSDTIKVIKEVKLVEDLESKNISYLKYGGEFRLTTDDTDGAALLDGLFNDQPNVFVSGADYNDRSTLKYMMQYAIMQYIESTKQDSQLLQPLPAVEPSGENLHAMIVDKAAHRIFQIGTRFEQEIKVDAKPMLCTLDKWSEMKGFRYIPKVKEHIDDKYYELDEDEFHETFQLMSIKVWLCTNRVQRIVRVVTSFRPKVLIFAIRYENGVQIEAPLSSPTITEILYVDALNSKVSKYDGVLQHIP